MPRRRLVRACVLAAVIAAAVAACHRIVDLTPADAFQLETDASSIVDAGLDVPEPDAAPDASLVDAAVDSAIDAF